ncbi:alpha/beta fold hydrolase [Allokutzneria albata]|uniref:Pimeloyl-ACP methyl ester carboxylesterase n=1 Tax=Allokutzneria albata TaxID=211114 RepID=A0A1G9T664_ALLAB|nr:alpha/beta hydrolase [Allokutzneria albata]SDM43126.1 Pimeloyl-ACP methyl ester carboxylesterase [Allokutzneria albata]
MSGTSVVLLEDGTLLNVVEAGAADAPVTVLFAHGYALDHRTWGRQFDLLPAVLDQPVRLLAYDHRGHGKSGEATEETATVEQLGDDLAQVVEQLIPTGTVVLVGHSMGGMAAMALAERRPRLFGQRVGGVVFVSTSAGGASEVQLGLPTLAGKLVQELENVFGPLVRKVRERIEPAKTAGLRWWLFGDDPRDEDVAVTAEMVWSQWPETVALFRPAFDRHDRTAALTVIQGKQVVVMAGEKDKLCPASHVSKIAEICGGGEEVVIPGAGHMLPLERAEDVTSHIAALVRRVT